MAVEEANGVSKAAIEEACRLYDIFFREQTEITVRALNLEEDRVSLNLDGAPLYDVYITKPNSETRSSLV